MHRARTGWPVALGEPGEEVLRYCRSWGARWARLAKRLHDTTDR